MNIGGRSPSSCPARRTSGSPRSKPRRAADRWSRYGRGGAIETVVDGDTGVLFEGLTARARGGARKRCRLRIDAARERDNAEHSHADSLRSGCAKRSRRRRPRLQAPMVRRHNRLLVVYYVITDALLAAWAFVLAYGIRFESGLVPVTRGSPPFEAVPQGVPFVALLARGVPLPGCLPPAARPFARGRFLRRPRRHHPRGGA